VGAAQAGTILGSHATPNVAKLTGVPVTIQFSFDIKYFNNENFGCGAQLTYQPGGATENIAIKAPMTTLTRSKSFTASGKVSATLSPYPFNGMVGCLGSQTATATIEPNTVAGVGVALKPSSTVIVQQGPIGMAPLPTLTSIKQVPYTDQGTETWIEVHGTGNCSYTITGAGLPASTFSSSAATPFPMKVKIPNAPIGSHLWTAKGNGACTGQATTTFTVQG
jgi:hypothetical protein